MKAYLPYRPYSAYSAGGSGVVIPLFSWLAYNLALGSTATFTRASTAYHQQPNGVWVPVLSGEARFSGARRVRNAVIISDMRGFVATATSTYCVITYGVSDPAGGLDAVTVTNGGGGIAPLYRLGDTFAVGSVTERIMWLRRRTGTGSINMYGGVSSSAAVEITAVLNDGLWHRVTLGRFTSTDTSARVGISILTAGDAVDVFRPALYINSESAPDFVPAGVATSSDLAVNGSFATDTIWVKGAGWTITGGVAVGTATTGNLELPIANLTPKAGKTYRVEFDLTVTSGTVRAYIGGTALGSAVSSATGHVIVTGAAANNTGPFYIDGVTAFTGTIDNVTIQECDHGANVDGVKYFPYANGNTVASNVVTEAQGAAIDPATISLLIEPAATNLCLQSQVAGTTWTQTNVTIAADAVAAPDGTTTADTLTASANNATWVQTTTAASAQKTWSIWIKRKTGTGAISMSLDGGSTYTEKTITATWWRYNITQTLANPSMVIKIGVNTDAVWVWGSQLEVGASATSYIPTTTTAVTRAVDALAYSGIPADNETRFVINGANVDVNDWNGTYPTPTVPQNLKSITVYGPGRRPA